jgi:predicted pyridoxine 5'-phosphate oxidase superfamily flavin-nucleotide-binding protein
MLDYLNPLMQEYISRQSLFFIGTADAGGNCDCSLRAGEEGVMRVVDETTLLYPEYRGNGVMASLGNIIENPHVGIFFGDFCHSTVGLHVNGTACLLSTDEVLASLAARSDLLDLDSLAAEFTRRLETWVRITVEETYIHCSKHIPLFKPLDKTMHWGTDDPKRKRGDYFHVRSQRTSQRLASPVQRNNPTGS